MDLATYRRNRGLTLEQAAIELGLKPSSKGWLSEIENGCQSRDASLKLALKIERWSGGQVKAATICKIAAEVAQQAPAE